MKKRKFNLSTLAALLLAVLVLAVFIPINLIASYYDTYIDMTPSKQYTFTDNTLKLLEDTADKDIDIFFLYNEEELRDAPEFLSLYNALLQLDEYENIDVEYFIPDENPALAQELNPSGSLTVSDADIFVRCGDVIKKIDSQRIFQFNSDGNLAGNSVEELISGAITIVTGGSLPTVYFLTGHGEKTINDSYATFASILKSDNYDVAELNLNDVDEVPENAAILMLAGPQQDITAEEKDKILAYADNGGSLAFFISPVDSDGRFENIEEILEDYELGIDYNIVKETSSAKMLNNRDYEQDEYVFQTEFTPATDEFTVDLTSEILDLIESGGLLSGISNTRSLYQIPTSTGFIEKSSLITNVSDEELGYTTVVEPMGGDSESRSENDKLNYIQLELGFYSLNKQNGSKLIALGTTDILDQDALSASVSVTQQLVLNSVVWLYNSDIDMEIGSKARAFDYMSFASAEKAEATLRIFTVIPICIAFVGLFVWLKRRHS